MLDRPGIETEAFPYQEKNVDKDFLYGWNGGSTPSRHSTWSQFHLKCASAIRKISRSFGSFRIRWPYSSRLHQVRGVKPSFLAELFRDARNCRVERSACAQLVSTSRQQSEAVSAYKRRKSSRCSRASLARSWRPVSSVESSVMRAGHCLDVFISLRRRCVSLL